MAKGKKRKKKRKTSVAISPAEIAQTTNTFLQRRGGCVEPTPITEGELVTRLISGGNSLHKAELQAKICRIFGSVTYVGGQSFSLR